MCTCAKGSASLSGPNYVQVGEEQGMLEHAGARLVEGAIGQGRSGQTSPGLEMLEKGKVRPEEGAGKDVVEAK